MLHSLDPLGEGKQGLLPPAGLPRVPPLLLLERIWALQMLVTVGWAGRTEPWEEGVGSES